MLLLLLSFHRSSTDHRSGKFMSNSRTTSTGAPRGVVFSPHCYSPSTPMTAHLKTPLSSFWSLQMTPHLSASFRTYLAPTHHHGQHCGCSGVIQIPGNPHLSGPEVGQSHRLNFQKGPAEVVLPSPAEGFQSATGAAETVLLGRRVCSVHFNNCLVWLSYKIRNRKTTENSSECWEDYWCSPAHPSRTVYIQSEEKGSENHSGSLTFKPSPFWTLPSGRSFRDANTKTTRHKNSFFPQAIYLMNS